MATEKNMFNFFFFFSLYGNGTINVSLLLFSIKRHIASTNTHIHIKNKQKIPHFVNMISNSFD